MTRADQVAAARDQLNRTLTFFTRVDSKASVVFGVNTGLIAVLATRAFPYQHLQWEWIPIGLTLLLLLVSFWHLYREAFPALDGGEQSRLYFREIAKRTEANYVSEWFALSEDEYLQDLTGQIWRNAQILIKKFDHMKWAFYSLALAVVPWVVSLVVVTLASPTTAQ